MTLLVRNEADIIKENLDFHFRKGVDHVIATDNGSTDETVDLLLPYIHSGVLTLLHEPEDNYDQAKWVTRMAMIAARDMGADWILNNDADEFWWCADDSLKDLLANAPGNVSYLPRQNMLPSPRWATGNPLVHMTYAVVKPIDTGSSLPTLNRIGRKAIVRSEGLLSIGMGNHDASFSVEKVLFDAPIIGFHYPIRSFAQFEQKVRQGGAALERNTELSPAMGAHWRRWFDMYKDGELRREYEQLAPTAQKLKSLRAGGIVGQDRRVLNEFLSTKGPAVRALLKAKNRFQTF
ncbi:glycosyltransferase family 2 protein [Ensifer adhaerens]|uniref:glycosyltransferase family 2 protein n=1 Tax=Ensifer adhaerens TaxID=106592 RepID=UPI0023A93E48|nr:glycosyltransferase family 2 protein [Ensifer adhaerens]WDZ75427.1 glycosyltransferase family 2 protein [Ensifer adhaerens]